MNNEKNLTPEQIADLKSRTIDTSDIPEITSEQWNSGQFRNWRPKKKAIAIRLDVDVLEAFRATGKGYQTRINAVLRRALAEGKF